MNSVCLVGRLTKDPELKTTPSDVEICNFSVAVNRSFKNRDGEYEADFINCTAFRKTAEFVQKYFVKGQFIGVTGSLRTRKWEDDEGKTRYATEVIVDTATFTEGKKSEAPSEVEQPSSDEELPF